MKNKCKNLVIFRYDNEFIFFEICFLEICWGAIVFERSSLPSGRSALVTLGCFFHISSSSLQAPFHSNFPQGLRSSIMRNSSLEDMLPSSPYDDKAERRARMAMGSMVVRV